MTKNDWKLIKHVMEKSKSTEWEEAKTEWVIGNIYEIEDDNFETCTCGHYPIKEVIQIRNRYNGNTIIVGNCCVNKFSMLSKNYSNFFHAIKKDKVNLDVIEQGFKDSVINPWEYEFMKNVWRKKKFSPKQSRKYEELNARLLNHYKKAEV